MSNEKLLILVMGILFFMTLIIFDRAHQREINVKTKVIEQKIEELYVK